MAEKMNSTTREKREKKISQLEARLQKERALLSEEKRKERNGQLIAFGIYLEAFLKAHPDQWQKIKNSMRKFLSERNLDRALAGLERIITKAQSPVQ